MEDFQTSNLGLTELLPHVAKIVKESTWQTPNIITQQINLAAWLHSSCPIIMCPTSRCDMNCMLCGHKNLSIIGENYLRIKLTN